MTDQIVEPQTTTGNPHVIIDGLTSVIIPAYIHSYPLLHNTGNTIGSVREHTTLPYEIVLVDDGSPINFPDPKIYNVEKYIKNEQNEGVTKSWNKGIRISQGEYICLLNNDVMIFNHWLEDLQECLKYKDLIMATPMYGEPFARAVESQKKRDQWKDKMIGETFSDFKDFSCVFAKRSLFNEVGLFDEQFKNYVSDSDLFKRMDQSGKTYALTKLVNTFHIIGATSLGLPEIADQMNEDKERFRKKWEEVQKVDDQGYQPLPSEHPNPSPSVPDLEPEQPKEYTVETMPKFVRTVETGDKIYFIKDGEAHWVTNPKMYESLDGHFGNEVEIKRTDFLKLKIGEPINVMTIQKYAV